MNYYILLPNKYSDLDINPEYTNEPLLPLLSTSLYQYTKDVHYQIQTIKNSLKKKHEISHFFKLFNTYNLLHINMPYHQYSIGKRETKSLLYYNFLEINNMINILDIFQNESINITINSLDSNVMINYFNELNLKYTHISSPLLIPESLNDPALYNNVKNEVKIDFIFYDLSIDIYGNTLFYIKTMVYILYYVLLNQNNNGTLIIKMTHIFYKPILDILYIICNYYSKIYIMRPYIACQDERFIMCKGFNAKKDSLKLLDTLFYTLMQNMLIKSIISDPLPMYWANKIDESNIIIGFHGLDHYDDIINILKSKNIDDRIDNYIKNSINKCIQWCKNMRLDYNQPEVNSYMNKQT